MLNAVYELFEVLELFMSCVNPFFAPFSNLEVFVGFCAIGLLFRIFYGAME